MSGERSRPIAGIIVIIIGAVLLINNFNPDKINIFSYWPVLLIIWGLNSVITGSKSFGAVSVSALVAVIGLLLLAKNLNLLVIDLGLVWRVFWPMLIIVIGLSIFLGQSLPGKTNLAVMGALERGKNSEWQLSTASYLAFMGGVELDLSRASIPEGETVLDLTAVMGGVDIKVPADLPVICDGFAILGGVNMLGKGSGGIIGSTRAEQNISAGAPRLVRIQARAIMGGVDVKRS